MTHVEGNEEVVIMEELPHTLRREIALVVNRKIFERLALFSDFPERELRAVANMMAPIKARARRAWSRALQQRGAGRCNALQSPGSWQTVWQTVSDCKEGTL